MFVEGQLWEWRFLLMYNYISMTCDRHIISATIASADLSPGASQISLTDYAQSASLGLPNLL